MGMLTPFLIIAVIPFSAVVFLLSEQKVKVTEQYVAAIQGLTVTNAASTYAQLGTLHTTYLEASQAITPHALEIASQAGMDEARFQDALATMYQTLLEQAGEISVQE